MSARAVSTGIGGSDVSAIRGENAYKTALDVWKRIVKGVPEPEAGLSAQLGNDCEESILCDYCVRQSIPREHMERKVEVSVAAEPYFRGELDAYFRRKNFAADAKLVLSPGVAKQWGDDGTDFMPTYILNQQAWYAWVANLDYVVVVGVVYGRTRDLLYTRSPAYEEMIVEDVRKFWRDHIETGLPPEPMTVDDALWMHPQPKSDIQPATDAERAIVAAWRDAKQKADDHDTVLERAKALVCAAIGDREGLWLGGNDRVTWKANKNGVRSLKG